MGLWGNQSNYSTASGKPYPQFPSLACSLVTLILISADSGWGFRETLGRRKTGVGGGSTSSQYPSIDLSEISRVRYVGARAGEPDWTAHQQSKPESSQTFNFSHRSFKPIETPL